METELRCEKGQVHFLSFVLSFYADGNPFYFGQKKTLENQGFQQRMTGVEPASKAWEAFILPMNYIRKVYRIFL